MGRDKGVLDPTLDAWADLTAELEAGETVEAVVFGNWGWSYSEKPENGGSYMEPEPAPVPAEKRAVVLTPEEARPMMKGWSFNGGYGAPQCYAVRIWTDRRVLWITQYDGATSLSAAPRNPTPHLASMPGGG